MADDARRWSPCRRLTRSSTSTSPPSPARPTGTVDAYGRILRQLTQWIAARPGNGGRFRPEAFTRTALETYLSRAGG